MNTNPVFSLHAGGADALDWKHGAGLGFGDPRIPLSGTTLQVDVDTKDDFERVSK